MQLEFPALRLQLLCYDNSALALRLLRIAQIQLCNEVCFVATVFSGNSRQRITMRSIEEIESSPAMRNFNTLQISVRTSGRLQFAVSMEVSPNNSLWADTSAIHGMSTRDERERQNLESLQDRVTMLGITHYPTSLDCYFAIPADLGVEENYPKQWLIKALIAGELNILCIGGADILCDSTGIRWSRMANELDIAEGGTQRNRGKFDAWHDFLVCDLPAARSMLGATDERMQIVPVVSGKESLAVIEVPPDADFRKQAKERLKVFFASFESKEVDAAARNRPKIHSRKEYLEAASKGTTMRLGSDEVLHSIISPQDAAGLELNFEDIPVIVMARALATIIEQERLGIGDPNHMGDADILWLYESIYSKYLNHEYAKSLFEFIRKLRSINVDRRP
jgi:hypothetical protein